MATGFRAATVRERAEREIHMLERPPRPTVGYFYKYSAADHLEWLESIILKNELYFPTLIKLNDPADARPRLAAPSPESFVEAVGRLLGYQGKEYQQFASETKRTIEKHGIDPLLRGMTISYHREQNNQRVYSLSKRWDNMSLWTKYAGDHSGYCLKFANDGPPFTSAYEVIYDGPVTIDITDEAQINAHYPFHKSKDWRCEEEVRILTLRGSPPLVTFDPKLLTRIILGKDMVEAHRTTIREWAQKRCPELVVVCAEYDAFEQRLIVGDPVVSGT
ncbi:MAG: hypothetical protein A3J28_02115 [Acidobacteria bacterium RIFCSPLOWO2_12_FULL_60_22]|nr:MAG: hypothetical protein A3J28_02115 [Acidobacteria bacterium RIFCSPLOWO2_12_FULL_60_22]